ncbi:murein biosynthesis integral membrane protein MurJ [Planctomicrobium sp. SH527]|uniref:murein biosynthesis integral membrane protein MurJ n=1 Tax=Planctomicrobium sp. SH527 TaxID=3448123 RepID=UPI003F5B3452
MRRAGTGCNPINQGSVLSETIPDRSASLSTGSESTAASDASNGTQGVMSNLRLVSLGTLLSRLMGLFRDIGMTTLFGAGTIFDAFVVAFRIPNLSRQLLGEGALSTAFLPVFIRSRDRHGMEAARELLTLTAILLAVTLTISISLAELGIGIVRLTASVSESTALLLDLLALMLPYSLTICLAALFCATLHAQRQFLWPALIPVVLNVILLSVMACLSSSHFSQETQSKILAGTVSLAGIIQLLIPLRILHRQGIGLVRHWSTGWANVREIISAMVPVLIGMSVLQASAIFDSLLAWGLAQPDDGSQAWCESFGISPMLEAGTAAAIYLGQRMLQFPLGVFGVALGTVLYPILTQHAQRGEMDLLRADLSRGIRIVIAIGIPASVGLYLIAWPLTIALFRWGEFSDRDAMFASQMIGIYSAGVWSSIGIAILNRAWYATGDRQTPMRLGLLFLGVNQILNLTLIWFVGGIGIALGSIITSGLLCLVTLWKLNNHVGPLNWRAISITLMKGIVCTAVMTIACFATMPFAPVPTDLLTKLIALGIPCVVGSAVYWTAAKLTGMTELEEFLLRK